METPVRSFSSSSKGELGHGASITLDGDWAEFTLQLLLSLSREGKADGRGAGDPGGAEGARKGLENS